MTSGRLEKYRLYGLRVVSEVPLHQNRPAPAKTASDVTIRWGEPIPLSEDAPRGRVLAHMETDRRYYTFTQTESGGYTLRFYRTCDFVIDSSLRKVQVHVVEGVDPGLAGVLAAGALLSFILTVRSVTVLHGSAVQVGDVALAFVGRSGMGKSTMAALMCAEGALLITDDVLRLDERAGRFRCRLGATELRLRKSASELSERFAVPPDQRTTSDARDALRMTESTKDRLPLQAVVIPFPDHESDAVNVTKLSPMDAMITLLRYPRLLGWSDSLILDRQFQQVGEVVERVPVFLAHVPWGPPFPNGVAQAIADAAGVNLPSPEFSG